MSAGQQFFDGSTGNPRLVMTDRLFKFFGVANIGNSYTGTTASGTITDSRFSTFSANTPFAFILNGSIDPDGNAPVFSFSGSNLDWSFPRSVSGQSWTRPDTTFVYGVF